MAPDWSVGVVEESEHSCYIRFSGGKNMDSMGKQKESERERERENLKGLRFTNVFR